MRLVGEAEQQNDADDEQYTDDDAKCDEFDFISHQLLATKPFTEHSADVLNEFHVWMLFALIIRF